MLAPISPEDALARKKLTGKMAQNFILPNGYKFRAHAKAKEIKDNISSHVWNTYFKFTIERNPWNKVISHYYWQKRNKDYRSIIDYIMAGELSNLKAFDWHSINGEVVVDKIYRFEDFNSAFSDLSKRLNLKDSIGFFNYKAKSKYRTDKRSYSEVLNEEERNRIGEFFKREIDLLNFNVLS